MGGILILKEALSFNTFVGCLLMLTGMMISQLWKNKNRSAELLEN